MCVVCACYFSPLSTSFVFHALNVIRFSCVGLCGTMRHSCDRAFKAWSHECRISLRMTNECHFLASVDIRRKCVSCPFDPLTRRSSLGNLRCLCVLFFFSFVNAIRFSCVALAYVALHVCTRVTLATRNKQTSMGEKPLSSLVPSTTKQFWCSPCDFGNKRLSLITLKEPGRSDCFDSRIFLQTFGDVGIRRKLPFFSLPLMNFTAEKIYHLEDINENLTSYGNHN